MFENTPQQEKVSVTLMEAYRLLNEVYVETRNTSEFSKTVLSKLVQVPLPESPQLKESGEARQMNVPTMFASMASAIREQNGMTLDMLQSILRMIE